MRMGPELRHAALVLVLAAGCQEAARPAPPRQRAVPPSSAVAASTAPTLFDAAYAFRCSPERATGCTGLFPPRDRSEAAILWGGEEALRARVATLRQARRSIRLQALIFRGDDCGLLVADLLKQKRREGLDVRVIVDALSNLDWQTQWMYFDLKRHGIEVEGYEALYMQWVTAELKPSDPLRPNKRFHDKMWIVDAEDPRAAIAIVGGLNIANEYFRVDSTPINRWHDQDVALRGAVVEDVTRAFDRNYEFFKSLKAKRPALVNPDNSWRLARKVLRRIGRVERPTWRSPTIGASIATMLERPARLAFAPVRVRFLQSRPRLEESYIEQAYLERIARARREILLTNAYFIPSRTMTTELRRAAGRGVRVVVLTNSPETNDIGSVALVSRHTYLDLIGEGSGIEIYEWSGAPFREGTLHAKYGVFDGESLIVGSFNLDPRSARLNSETVVALADPGLAQALARRFREEDLPRARRVSAKEAAGFRRPQELGQTFQLLFALPVKDWL